MSISFLEHTTWNASATTQTDPETYLRHPALKIRYVIYDASLPGRVCFQSPGMGALLSPSVGFGARPSFQWHEKYFCCKLGSQSCKRLRFWEVKSFWIVLAQKAARRCKGLQHLSRWAFMWCIGPDLRKHNFFCCCLMNFYHLFICRSLPISPITSHSWPCQIKYTSCLSPCTWKIFSSYFRGISGKRKRRIR